MTKRQIEKEFTERATRKYLGAWIESAEEFFRVAKSLSKTPCFGNICFNARQCADFYLKAFLIQNDVAPRITWNLPRLNRSCIAIDPSFKTIVESLKRLAPFDENVLYPGFSATEQDAQDCVGEIKKVRRFIRARLGLSK